MTHTAINPERLKALRSKRQLRQEELAGKMGVDVGTVSRWERGKVTRLRLGTFRKLCSALNAEEDQLCGDGPLPEVQLGQQESEKGQVNLVIDTLCRNALGMVALRYGVTRQQIVEVAPLLFFIAAEQSLRERKERCDSFLEALEVAWETSPSHLPLDFYYQDDDDEALEAERESIEARDLFATRVAQKVGLDVKDEGKENPFARFLTDQLKNLSPSGKTIPVHWDAGLSPYYIVCEFDVLEYLGGDKDAAIAVLGGQVALHQMPAEVRRSSPEERANWVKRVHEDALEQVRNEDPEEFIKNLDDAIKRVLNSRSEDDL